MEAHAPSFTLVAVPPGHHQHDGIVITNTMPPTPSAQVQVEVLPHSSATKKATQRKEKEERDKADPNHPNANGPFETGLWDSRVVEDLIKTRHEKRIKNALADKCHTVDSAWVTIAQEMHKKWPTKKRPVVLH